jgi:hypothetical protein
MLGVAGVGLDLALEGAAGLELEALARGDLDLLFGAGFDARASLRLDDAEGSQAGERDAALLHATRDSADHGVHGGTSGFAGNASLRRDFCNQMSLTDAICHFLPPAHTLLRRLRICQLPHVRFRADWHEVGSKYKTERLESEGVMPLSKLETFEWHTLFRTTLFLLPTL